MSIFSDRSVKRARIRAQRIFAATREQITPFLAADEQALLRNMDRMQALCDGKGVQLRPHVKTHKSTTIAALQRDRGATGITVATLAEAEVFAAAGHSDILAVFPPTDVAKQKRFERLARAAQVTFSVDDARGVSAVANIAASSGAVVSYVWEVDTGTARAGTHPMGTAKALISARDAHPHARFAGLMSFGGHLYGASTINDVTDGARRDAAILGDVSAQLVKAGLRPPSISVGATPGAISLISHPAVTELRAGNYVYNDATQIALGSAALSDCAMVVVSTVTGRPSHERALIDAGSKSIPKEIMSTLTSGYGLVLGYPSLRVTRLFEEVGVIEGPTSQLDLLQTSDRVAIIPNHSCSASILYPELRLVQQQGEARAIRIDARDH